MLLGRYRGGLPRSENSLLNSAHRNFRSSIRVASHFFTVQPPHHLNHSDNRLAKESGERARNLLRGRETLAGCRGAAMTVILSITRKVGDTGIASCKQKTGIPEAIPYQERHCRHHKDLSGIPCHSPSGIPPSGLTTTGFDGIKTLSCIPFHT